RAQRRSRRPGGGRRADGRHEPLPEDRVWPPSRRAKLGRLQFRHHHQQAPQALAMTDDIPGDAPKRFGFETRAVHAGTPPDPTTGARIMPIYHTTAYVFDDAEHAASLFDLSTFGYIYSRLTNPTVAALEERIASLEDGRGATCTASGHAAQLIAMFSLMGPGDEFIASRRLYGGSITQFGRTFAKFDWKVHFVDADDSENFRRALTPRCKAIFV